MGLMDKTVREEGGWTGFSMEPVVVEGGGWLGETTVAGGEQRSRGRREAGEAAVIHESGACVFFPPSLSSSCCGDALQCLQTDRQTEDREGRRQAGQGPAHLTIDLQAIKVSVFILAFCSLRVCVDACVHVWLSHTHKYTHLFLLLYVYRHESRTALTYARSFFDAVSFLFSFFFLNMNVFSFGCVATEQQVGS